MVPAKLAAAVVVAAAAFTHASRAGDGTCIADWSIAAPIVRSEGLVTVEELSHMVRARLDASIVKATLCETDGRYSFRVVMRSRQGLKSLTVDAKAPFDR